MVRLGAAAGKDADGMPSVIGVRVCTGNVQMRVVPRKAGLSSPVTGRKGFFIFYLERCDLMLISTTPTLEGMKILCYLNVVFGEVIVGTDFCKDFAAGFTNFFGGRSEEYEESLAQARQDAIEEMKKRAEDIGANAIVGVDIDYESHAQMLMVIASGTAVVVETLEKE